jgi:uncharacterized protein YcbX
VSAIEDTIGAPVHPLRFRANIYVRGWLPWREFDLVGRELAIGRTARVKIIKRILRCAAIDVDPETGFRDRALPGALMRGFGHPDCGVYSEVVNAGEIAVGDQITEVR